MPENRQTIWLVAAIWVALVLLVGWAWRRAALRRRNLDRLYAEDDAIEARVVDEDDTGSALARWLYLAGFRSRAATTTFVAATLSCAGVGLAIALSVRGSGLVGQAVRAAGGVPGGAGDLARPVLAAGPWILFAMLVLLPYVVVNSRRKERVRAVEQDMPVTLELLATMSESGLAFDGALDKVIGSQREERPLLQELRTFQLEVLGGVSRVLCFRRLARRLEVPAMTIFVSALVQAEQVGAGFSSVLRAQADDLRNRRREDANMLAQALPVKLIFPLVICFLPAIFVITLGPIFLQFLQMVEGMSRRG